jgi:predicted nuclease of restriction endonuclease-like RecB superfamily
VRLALQVLDRLLPESPQRDPSPREVRLRVFRAATDQYATRRQVFERVARELRVEVDRVEESLFADLASQKRVAALPQGLSPAQLALLANQALVHWFLKRAERVRIKAWGNAHALVRHAQRLGLICNVFELAAPEPRRPDAAAGVTLDISGPFALFRKTEVYGRSLASLLPRATRCQHFELEADCVLGPGTRLATLHLSPYDPIYPGAERATSATRAQARFSRDLGKLAKDWQVVHEPDPIQAVGTLLFPDLQLVHRAQPERRYSLEIVGFWTPEHLREKLSRLSAAGVERYFLCVDEARRASEADVAPDPRLLRYEKRLDAARVLAALDVG